MDIRHLKYFTEVVCLESFSRAAEKIHVSQSTVSKAIRELEDELGDKLLIRNAKSFQLTDKGSAFYHEAQKIVEAFDSLPEVVEDNKQHITGTLTVGVPPSSGAVYLPVLVSTFVKENPLIMLKILDRNSKAIEDGILYGSIDIGFSIDEPKSIFNTSTLFKDRLLLVISKYHKLSGCASVNISDLSNESFALFNPSDKLFNLFYKAGFQPKVQLVTTRLSLTLDIVKNNMNVTVLPQSLFESVKQNRRYDDLIAVTFSGPPMYLELYALWNNKRHLSQCARAFIKCIENYTPHIDSAVRPL